MSLFSDAQVTFLLCDYAANDAAGKLNVIGAGVTFLNLVAGPGTPTPPFTLVAQVNVPASHADKQYALTVELFDVTRGQIVNMPADDPGQLQALRAQQVVTVGRPMLPPGLQQPDNPMMGNTMMMAFPQGLPLQENTAYEWRVQIDGQTRHWFYRFHVLGPQPGVIIGGPANPSRIPGIGEYVVDRPSAEEPPATDV